MKNVILLLFATVLVVAGCKKDTKDPAPPEIEFGGFNYIEKDAEGNDTRVEMIIKFKDVNGDIGTMDGEKTDNCGYDYPDLFMFYEKYENGAYVPSFPEYVTPPLNDTVFDSHCNIVEIRDTFQSEVTYSVPYIEPEGNNKSVEGEISYDMDIAVVLYGLVKPQGRFRVYLKDRAGNKSNEILTEPLILKLP